MQKKNSASFGAEFFVPLRGWYLYMDDGEATYKVFAPLRGWYSLALTKLDEALVFAPLRGWYENEPE